VTNSPLHHTSRPAPLLAAVGLVGLEALVLAVLAVLELAHLSGARLTMGVTTTLFFLGYAVALAACGYGLLRLVSWARSPVVLAQLIQLGLAWSWRVEPAVAIPLALVAVAALVGVLAPASLAALEPHEDE
jgi:hypothetical protein